ncbi:MAG: hypothetical protein KJ072_02160 [Verrucomicrobia bacterium]|nr:hypothetical protein [Verrucomicrobiota bacterium]
MNRRTQLEMPLEPTAGFRRGRTPRRRMTRARWWFSQMRLAVEQASDWEPDPVKHPVELEGASGRMNVS